MICIGEYNQRRNNSFGKTCATHVVRVSYRCQTLTPMSVKVKEIEFFNLDINLSYRHMSYECHINIGHRNTPKHRGIHVTLVLIFSWYTLIEGGQRLITDRSKEKIDYLSWWSTLDVCVVHANIWTDYTRLLCQHSNCYRPFD
jgi:hypothetical protein